MISIKINGIEFLSKPSVSILEACKNVGITIPRFCYHELLSISGNCRMCLVEIEDLEKPVASCVTEVVESMSIYVDSPFVKKARESVIESLLLHHPLDCPICDQAGECDLQDQTKVYGSGQSRYFFNKKGTEDKYCGPLIKTIMTRCIKCTRCVRYSDEITGINYFGTLNRGVETEIGSYVTKLYNSEISGNVIDLCPVGALTSKPYAFKARPWELRVVESIDTSDSLGANIYINYKDSEILRVLPKNAFDINESLITDKARFNYDANNFNRLSSIYMRSKNEYKDINWPKLFKNLEKDSLGNKFNLFINRELDLETLVNIKYIKNISLNQFRIIDTDLVHKKSNLYFNKQTNLQKSISAYTDFVVFLGTNLRFENALLNARIRHKYRKYFLSAFTAGNVYENNFPVKFINLNLSKSLKMFEGKCQSLSHLFQVARNGLLFVGESFMNRIINVDTLIFQIEKMFRNLKIIQVPTSSNTDGLNWLNIKRQTIDKNGFNIQINSKEKFLDYKILSVIREGHISINTHTSYLSTKYKYLIPTKTVFEHAYGFLNLEHRMQKTTQALDIVPESRTPNTILASIFNINPCNVKLLKWYSHLNEQIQFSKKSASSKKYTFLDKFFPSNSFVGTKIRILKYPTKQVIKDFYLSSRLSFYSKTMKKCSAETKNNFSNF